MIQNIRLRVLNWDGGFRHERYLEHADPALRANIPADGIEAWRTGHGGCLELTLQAIWPTLRAESRDLLELDTQDENGAWKREWAGVVVKAGNSQVTWDHTNFKAAGLRKRLTEVRVRHDVQEGDVGAQVRQALTDLLSSGDLGQGTTFTSGGQVTGVRYTILPDTSLIPDTGTLLGGFPARGRKFSELLDYLAAQAGCVWDVDEYRRLFFRKPGTGTILLTEGTDVTPTYEDTDSEALVTRVRLNLGKWTDGTLIQYMVDGPDADDYGVAEGEVNPDLVGTPIWRTVGWSSVTATNTSTPDPEVLALLRDFDVIPPGNPSPPAASFSRTAPAQPAVLTFTLAAPAWRIAVNATWFKADGVLSINSHIEITPPGEDARTYYPPADAQTQVRRLQGWLDTGRDPFPAGTVVRVISADGPNFLLVELRPEAPNAAILDPLAQFHMVSPRRDPATITARRPVTPQPNLRLMRTDGTPYETTTESVGLFLKLGQLETNVIKAGQREPAEVRAKRWLDQQALATATMDAVRFGAGT